MKGRIKKSWELSKICLAVVRKDKELLAFPILAAITMGLTLVLALLVMMNLFFQFTFSYFCCFYGLSIIVISFGLYLVLYFIGVYFKTAIIGCATIRLKGENSTIKDGFKTSNKNIIVIAKWSFYAATIGTIIKMLSENKNIFAKIAGQIADAGWSIATFFIIPVLIYEKRSLKDSFIRSASLFKNIWGETIRSEASLGILFFLFFVLGFFLTMFLIFLGSLTGGITYMIAIIFFAVYLIIFIAIIMAAQGVLIAALYQYATTGKVAIIPERILGPKPMPASLIPEYEGRYGPLKPSTGFESTPESMEQKLKYLRYREEISRQKEVPDGFIRCPNCDTINPKHEQQCRFCAEFLE